jgi:hypothetical protein
MTVTSSQAKSGVHPIPKPERQPKGRRERERPTLYTYGFLPGETPTCWLAQFAPDVPCDGRMDPVHLIRKQVIRREVSRSRAVLWTPAVLKPGCRRHHTMLDQSKTLRIPSSALPGETEAWALENGLEWWLIETYGERVS